MSLSNIPSPGEGRANNGSDRWVKIEMPGGLSCVITESTYRRLLANNTELSRCLEKAEIATDIPEKPLKLVRTRYWWKRLFL